MNRQEILALAAMGSYPSVTLTLTTHRTSPDNRQDPIRLKNLLTEAQNRLTGEFGKREVADVLRALDELAGSIDHQYNLDGLALFVSSELAQFHRLPFALPDRVMVDERFFTRDLVYAYNRSPRYWVLALSEQQTRLFEAVRDDLQELRSETPFPMVHSGVGGGRTIPTDPRINTSQLRDEHSRIFFRDVDQALGRYLAEDPLPVALVGVDRNLAFFKEVSTNSDYLLTDLTGNHDQSTAHMLGGLVWPPMKEALAARRTTIFDDLEAAVGGQRSASTIGEVYRFAQEGRVATLIVEEDYHVPATIDASGALVLDPDVTTGPEALDDAVDATIATVIAKGGRVRFVDDGSLSAHSQIAAILRY